MDDQEHKGGFEDEEEIDRVDSTTRARNRTMMLTPEMAVEMRSRLGATQKQPLWGNGSDEWNRVSEFGRESAPPPHRGDDERPSARNTSFQDPYPNDPSYYPEEEIPAGDRVFYKSLSPIVGFFVSFDKDTSGGYLELRTGRVIVTSEGEATGNALIIPDETVSPQHAVLRIVQGEPIQILDQLSEFGTKIVRQGSGAEEVLNGDKSTLAHGDQVIFGERAYHVCLIDRPRKNE